VSTTRFRPAISAFDCEVGAAELLLRGEENAIENFAQQLVQIVSTLRSIDAKANTASTSTPKSSTPTPKSSTSSTSSIHATCSRCGKHVNVSSCSKRGYLIKQSKNSTWRAKLVLLCDGHLLCYAKVDEIASGGGHVFHLSERAKPIELQQFREKASFSVATTSRVLLFVAGSIGIRTHTHTHTHTHYVLASV
jgi:hypothetical protein